MVKYRGLYLKSNIQVSDYHSKVRSAIITTKTNRKVLLSSLHWHRGAMAIKLFKIGLAQDDLANLHTLRREARL
jgi:hypothetical protein